MENGHALVDEICVHEQIEIDFLPACNMFHDDSDFKEHKTGRHLFPVL
jgi:hypothetical protein